MYAFISDAVDIDRCRINDISSAAASSVRSAAAALFFKPTHLKLPTTSMLAVAISKQVIYFT